MGTSVSETRFKTKDGREVEVRPPKLVDAAAMTAFVNQLAKEKKVNRDLGIASFDSRATVAFERRWLRSIIQATKRETAVTMVAFSSGKLVGECTLRRQERRDMRHTGVLGIVVLRDFRGVGLGKDLMKVVLRSARRMGVWLVELEVMAINRAAIRLYKKVGFRAAGVIPGKILRDGRELDMVVMFADLRGTDKFPRRRRGKS